MLKGIDDEVDHLVNQYETNNPFQLMKELSIKSKWDFLPDRILGYSTLINRIPVITLNQSISGTPSAYSVASHELGHSIFHRGVNTKFFAKNATKSMVDQYENEANIFMFKLIFHEADPQGYFSNQNKILNYYGLPSWMNLYFEFV